MLGANARTLSKTSVSCRNKTSRVLNYDSNNVVKALLETQGKGKVCIIRRVGGIGDVLMATPSLRELKIRFPNCHLTFAIDMHSTSDNNYLQLLRGASFINKIEDARYVDSSKYDAVVDISSVCFRQENKELNPLNRIDIFAKTIGLNGSFNKLPFYASTKEEREYAQSKMTNCKNVVLHTASFELKRSWPINKYLELIQMSKEQDIVFHVFDFNNKLKYWSQESNCRDHSNTSVRKMAAIIEAADLFIGPDSGPMHIAAAVNTPAIVLFGSIPPETRINHYPLHEAIVAKGLKCLGCWYKPCSIGVKCMTDIKAETVYKAMLRRL